MAYHVFLIGSAFHPPDLEGLGADGAVNWPIFGGTDSVILGLDADVIGGACGYVDGPTGKVGVLPLGSCAFLLVGDLLASFPFPK